MILRALFVRVRSCLEKLPKCDLVTIENGVKCCQLRELGRPFEHCVIVETTFVGGLNWAGTHESNVAKIDQLCIVPVPNGDEHSNLCNRINQVAHSGYPSAIRDDWV